MNTELENLLKLVVGGLTLNDFNWSDVENGCIKDLYFSYTTHSGKKGTLDLGNIGIDFYEDDGDHCLELTTGEIVLVSNQWGNTGKRAYFGVFKDVVEDLGYIIK